MNFAKIVESIGLQVVKAINYKLVGRHKTAWTRI